MKNSAEKLPPSNSKLSSLCCSLDLLALRSKRTPGVVAIGTSGLLSLTHGGLPRNVEDTVRTLTGVSASRNGRVATALPSRSELVAFVRDIALGAPATTLRSASGQSKLNFSLSELGDQPPKEAPC
jgi:hypothetical protein